METAAANQNRPGPVDAIAHEAVLHSAPADLALLLAPRIAAALAEKTLVVAAMDHAHRPALESALGSAAADVEFQDPEQVHSVPGFTVAVRWARLARRHTPVLIVGQHVPGLPVCEPAHWARLDIALNVAIAGAPITMLCPYSADSPELSRVRDTHPILTTSDGSQLNPAFRPPRDTVVDFPPPPPPELGRPVSEMVFGDASLVALRHVVGQVAASAGLAPERVADAVLAVSELASNSIEHGAGSGVLRLWRGAELVAEITDDGGGMAVPFPGIAVPPPESARGRGLWLASELCDVLQVWSDDTRTVVRVKLR